MNTGFQNPLLLATATPRFDAVRPEHVEPAIDRLLSQCDLALQAVTALQPPFEFDRLSALLDTPLQALHDAWGVVTHLLAVANTPALRAAHAAVQARVTAFQARLASDERLFGCYLAIEQAQAGTLPTAKRQALRHRIRDFRLSGVGLPAEHKQRFLDIQQRSAELGREFSNRLLDATDAFVEWAPEADLAGVPTDVRAALREAARIDGQQDACKLTLQQSCLGPLMQFADNRALRERLYRASVTRASEFGPPELDNTALIAEILALRRERAQLLGYANHAEVSLQPKMAQSPAQVLSFLAELGQQSRARAENELRELRDFARAECTIDDLQAWDVAYVAEKLRLARHAFGEEEVRRYFTLDKVLAGAFALAETLFDIRIHAERLPTWHDTVSSWRVECGGRLLGRLMLDPFSRTGKRGGAWLQGAQPRWQRADDSVRPALAYLVTNFAAPSAGQPAHLSHSEVVTLFHEMGHALHFLLCQEGVPGVSGFSGVEWDAIELPSQLMENFAFEWPVLQQISADPGTGAPLPRALFDKMNAARDFRSASQLLRQVELASFDMRVHAEPTPCKAVQTLFDEVRAAYGLLPTPSYNRFQNGFSHIFAGAYAAGYYGYLWAEVLAADAWRVFECAPMPDVATGLRYRQTILERGGSRPMSENFRSFVGRDPRSDALLERRGIVAKGTVHASAEGAQ